MPMQPAVSLLREKVWRVSGEVSTAWLPCRLNGKKTRNHTEKDGFLFSFEVVAQSVEQRTFNP
jgi:hypothetical protein